MHRRYHLLFIMLSHRTKRISIDHKVQSQSTHISTVVDPQQTVHSTSGPLSLISKPIYACRMSNEKQKLPDSHKTSSSTASPITGV